MNNRKIEGMVTVVVPIYNVERYLDRCITSIVNQSYRNLEILLIDDESPDRCPQMCDEWARKDSRIRVIHKKNQGLGMARNSGIDNALGEYICFFDSDDYVDPKTIETAYINAKQNNADIVVFGMLHVDKDNNIYEKKFPCSNRQVFQGDKVKNMLIPAMVSEKYYNNDSIKAGLSCCELLVSMDAINNSGWRLVSERSIISEDVYSLLRLYSEVESVVILPDAFYYYCQNAGSLTKKYRKDRFEKIIEFQQKAINLCVECGYPESVQKGINSMCFSFVIGMLKSVANSDESRLSQLREIRRILDDRRLQELLADLTYKEQKDSWKILIKLMTNKHNILTYISIKLKS